MIEAAEIIIAVLSSSAVASAVSGIVTLIGKQIEKKSGMHKKIESLEHEVAESKLDLARIQLMLLISDYPDDISEVMKAAEKYFKDLGGNWYMSSIFNKWLVNNNLAKPEWFKE